jgi:hypothetical protein
MVFHKEKYYVDTGKDTGEDGKDTTKSCNASEPQMLFYNIMIGTPIRII